ncbi:MAG TPA: hypothetical protein VFM46_11990 [Pseudomonadales bacterium]|nr:hypothetical protein [Pseudomonadales bacterium]
MLDAIREALAPGYLYIKFIHLFFVMIWSWSTSVAYTWYVKGAYLKWEKNPNDPQAIQRRNYAQEQFDKGAVLEHVAFPVVMITGPLLYWIGPWTLDFKWVLIKILIVLFIFVPIEVFDYYLSHFGGNKEKLRRKGLMDKYEISMRRHWTFLKVTTPFIVIFMPLVIFLATVKPF